MYSDSSNDSHGIQVETRSDRGLVRPTNEDALIYDLDKRFFAVADGMGGAAAGEVASRLFIESVRQVFVAVDVVSNEAAAKHVEQVFRLANATITDYVKHRPQCEGMGCTAELLVLADDHYFIGHVGDSRTYLFRNHRLFQLTRDHSLVQQQIDEGVLTPDAAQDHPLRHIILRAVGTQKNLALDIVRGTWRQLDLFLLCTDGLTDMVEPSFIQTTLGLSLSLSEKADKLLTEALNAGGRDNISILLVQIIE